MTSKALPFLKNSFLTIILVYSIFLVKLLHLEHQGESNVFNCTSYFLGEDLSTSLFVQYEKYYQRHRDEDEPGPLYDNF